MEVESYAHGEPCWQDQSSSDSEKAVAFYSGLFGWQCPEASPELGGYRNCLLRGRNVAGISPLMDPSSPTAWSIYVKVDDADDVAARVRANGGQVVVEPMDVMDLGRMAFFIDPTGAAFGTWQPGVHRGAGVRNEHGAFCWHELITTDVAAATTFYAAVFGWAAHAHGPAGPGGYTEFQVGEKMVAGMMAKPAAMPAEAPPYWGVYFAVDDVDAAVARVAELGGRVLFGPMDIEPGRFATVADSTGAAFNILKSSRF